MTCCVIVITAIAVLKRERTSLGTIIFLYRTISRAVLDILHALLEIKKKKNSDIHVTKKCNAGIPRTIRESFYPIHHYARSPHCSPVRYQASTEWQMISRPDSKYLISTSSFWYPGLLLLFSKKWKRSFVCPEDKVGNLGGVVDSWITLFINEVSWKLSAIF